jgi:hypothetical protein
MKIGWGLAAAGVVAMGTGCHSAFVEATVSNRTGEPVSVVEVDYPSASFGTETLGAGKEFHYRFKVQGDGNLKVLWTDAQQHDHTANGPALHEGAEGGLGIVLEPGGRVDWNETLKK